METRQIRYFLAACETLNFSRAAEQCNVAVPTLTKAIDEAGGNLVRPGYGTLVADAGVGVGTNEGEVAGRAGLTFGW